MKLAGIDRRGKVMIMIAWLASCVFSTPQAYIFHVETHPNVTTYTQCVTYNVIPNESIEIMYSFMGMIVMYAMPLAIIIFCYASIYRVLLQKSRKCLSGLGNFKNANTLQMFYLLAIIFLQNDFGDLTMMFWVAPKRKHFGWPSQLWLCLLCVGHLST